MREENPKIMAILARRPARDFKSYIRKALAKQWMDVLYSAQFDMLYNKYAPFISRKTKSCGVHKAEDELDLEIDRLFGYRIDSVKPKMPEGTIRRDVQTMLATGVVAELGAYKNIKNKYRGYLTYTANKGGQEIMDLINELSIELKLTRIGHVADIKFRLSHSAYKNVIEKRVDKFFKDLDKTTKKRLERALVNGLGQEMGKDALRDNLISVGSKISKYRAEMIAQTETVATLNYMKMEAASMNGITVKTWHAVGPRPCPLCVDLDGTTIHIDGTFSESGTLHPPAHPNCQCECTYDARDSINALQKGYVPFKPSKLRAKEYKGLNPFAVWAGGESLVGVDKEIGLYYRRLKQAKKEQTKDRILTEARAKLTNIGYNQLKLRLQS